MDDAKVNEMGDMWDAGLNLTQIAQEMGTSTAVVRKALTLSGKTGFSEDDKLEKDQEVINMYNEGLSIKVITLKQGISVTKLYNILAKHKVPIRSIVQQPTRDRQLEEAVAMYEDGVVLHQIVSDTGVPQPTLHAELHRRGIKLRRPRRRRMAK